MNTPAISAKITNCPHKICINKNLIQKTTKTPLSQDMIATGFKMGSCGGMMSWSTNSIPVAEKSKIYEMGSCGGMMSWSTNSVPVAEKSKIYEMGSCGGMMSWSTNSIPMS